MKRILMLGFLVSFSSFCFAQETIPFPQENPLVNVFIPEYWSTGIYYEGTMLEAVSEDESIYFSITALDTDDLLQAVFKIHNEAKLVFEEHDRTGVRPKNIEYYVYDLFVLSDIEKL